MQKIAITGSIASGKSTLLRFFQEKGFPAIDSDEIVSVLYKDEGIKARIIKMFGSLDRAEIAIQIFANPAKRKKLEHLLHPFVVGEIERRLELFKEQNAKAVFVEVPLLFEAGLEGMFDKVIATIVSREEQVSRLLERGITKDQALARIDSQLPQEQKVNKADFAIDTNSLHSMEEQAEMFLRELDAEA